MYSKTKTLEEAYEFVDQLYQNEYKDVKDSDEGNLDSISDDVALALEKLGSNKNLSIYIFDIDDLQPLKYPQGLTIKQYNQIKDLSESTHRKIIKNEKNQYQIYKVYDERTDTNNLNLVGSLSDKEQQIFILTNLESMNESAHIANKFLAYVGVAVTCIGTMIMFFISKSFTKPILELSDIAKKMSDLDFDVKYPVSRNDEIGQLGTSINILSERLEETISELKTANNELKTDIENKIQIDEMRTEFLSNVTHELKTPIALIQGYAEGLKDNVNDDEESKEFYCDVIVDEAMKMNNMVKKLLSLNQIEYGNNQVNMERFDIVAVIKSVLAATELFFQQKNVVLHFEEPDPIYVWADEYMVEEVVTNYISNALNHVSGQNIIEVKLIQREEVVRIAVFNTGDNIPEEDIDNIWIKFYKVDKARTREYGGNGIGLSIVKAIMNSLNRECGVVNRQAGVEFWFELDTKI
ncbi:two-component sensor histidine kinase [Anaeromicropila herbilytica]|uniref:histidine kinase n=2 Tax=Anaeromicropila herbilytica TaxID=2785025 RepID=A0A7R7ID18_9FIRM|nr:two-component sensor histidine kinase [Anaeromicropila herbilytica]